MKICYIGKNTTLTFVKVFIEQNDLAKNKANILWKMGFYLTMQTFACIDYSIISY